MSQNNAPEHDPLLGAEKRPAVSFKDLPVGTVKTLEVESFSREAQTTVFGSNPPKLAFWPGNTPGEQGNPKMAVVFDVLENGEPKSLWAPIPSSLRTALAKAQTEAGKRIGPGGTLRVRLSGKKESGKGNPQNLFEAKWEPAPEPDPLAGGGSNPWGTPAPAAAYTGPSGPAAPPSDEPPFAHRTGFDVDILRGDAVVI